MKRSSIAFKINSGYLVLVVLLLALGGISVFSISQMIGSLTELNGGMASVRLDLNKALGEMNSVEEGVGHLQRSATEFDKLRQMKSALADSERSMGEIGTSLEHIEKTFATQSENLVAISRNLALVSSEIREGSAGIQQIILAAEGVNARMLNSYIGFFNYLNEFTRDVEKPLTDIEAISGFLKQAEDLLTRFEGTEKEQTLVKSIGQDLRRYRRYMSDLGETTSTTQISELKESLVRYGSKIIDSARELRDGAWQIAARHNAMALEIAAGAEASAQSAVGANDRAATVVADAVALARDSSSQIGDLTQGLSSAIQSVDRTLAEVPRAVQKATESMTKVRGSMAFMNTAIESAAQSVEKGEEIRVLMVSVCLGAILFGLFIGAYIHRKIVAPLSRFTEGLARAAQNDLTVKVDPSGTSGELKELILGMNRLLSVIQSNVFEMKAMTQKVMHSARILDRISADTSESLQKQRGQTSMIAAATEEMSASTHEIASSSGQADQQVQQVFKLIEDGIGELQHMLSLSDQISSEQNSAIARVQELADDSGRINAITATINAIAQQTNLLSLNAAVEAARAGQHGRGFAVVAGEVKVLAERTSKATGEIADLVQSFQEKIGPTVKGMNRCGEASRSERDISAEVVVKLDSVKEAIGALSDQVTQIATSTEQQDQAFPDITSCAEVITRITEDSADKMVDLKHRVEDLVTCSEKLQKQIAIFKVDPQEKGRRLPAT